MNQEIFSKNYVSNQQGTTDKHAPEKDKLIDSLPTINEKDMIRYGTSKPLRIIIRASIHK